MRRKHVHRQIPATLTSEPWRNVINWKKSFSVDHHLQDLMEIFASSSCDDSETPLNILLTGIVESGKSSFVNSIYSMFARRIVSLAESGASETRITEQYRMYKLRHTSRPKPLPWKIGDTAGMVASEGNNQVCNILQIVDGHVPEGYKFAKGETFDAESPSYIDAPSSNKAHCVAIVINANSLPKMSYDEINMLQSLRKGLMRRGIPTYVLLAFIDITCKEVGEDLTKVYRSVLVKDLVSKTSKMLLNLPISNILPVVNYIHQIELDDNMDILLLNAFSQLVGAKERKSKKMKCKITDAAPVTTSCVDLPYYNIFILGQIGSGKSTFFNGINAIMTSRMLTTKAEAGEMAFSLTKKFRMYKIKAPGEEKVLKTRICDTFGLKQNADDDTDVRNLLSAINGHVPDKHIFTDDEFHQDSPGYIALPTLENRAHCVGIVIDAQKVSIMHDNMWRKLRSVYTAVTNQGIPAKILLMKIDLVLGDNESFENIHTNKKVCQVKQVIQKKLGCNVNEKDMFPIKNYVHHVEFDVDMDILLLDSLLEMLMCAHKYLESK